ncbi:unnamed protein product [Choristocarpus tenellus]
MALVPFSYASPFTDQLRLRKRFFTIGDKFLTIKQLWKNDGKGGSSIGFGASVYPAAYVIAEYLERHPELIKGKKVIELGAGTGFLGIAAAVLGASEVCITDGDEGLLDLIADNVRSNLCEQSFSLFLPCLDHVGEAKSNGKDGTVSTPGAQVVKYIEEKSVLGAVGSVNPHREDGCLGGMLGSEGGDAKGRNGGRSGEETSVQKKNVAAGDLSSGKDEDTCLNRAGRLDEAGGARQADGFSEAVADEVNSACMVSVRRLLWGSLEDLKGIGGPYDVVIGSDIVALPYENAYASLIETLSDLLAPAASVERVVGGESTSGRVSDIAGASAVENLTSAPFAVLAYKQRHISEGSFFEAARGVFEGCGTVIAEGRRMPSSGTSAQAGGVTEDSTEAWGDGEFGRMLIPEPETEVHEDFRSSGIQLIRFRASRKMNRQ